MNGNPMLAATMHKYRMMHKKRYGKENSNPNLQNTLLQTASTTGTLGTRHNVIAPNTLIQAATMHS
uniref:Uncharacterized protein n=1 Tax=Triticum urartu TaxID=4572 RepID=A0A8R7UPP0_TRIUA